MEVTDLYHKQHGVDPSEIICEAHLSDYASGPESGVDESVEEWRIRMGKKCGMDHTTMHPEVWEAFEFWEQVKPAWRSDEVSRRALCVVSTACVPDHA
jgi:hypothetical protein